MKRFFPILIFISPIFFACSKKSSPDPVPTPVDTLATGWKKVSTSIGGSDIFFINNSTGYLAGSSIYRSTDGGNNWQEVYKPSNSISNIAMGSELNAVFIPGSSQVIVTKDGGVSFNIVTIADMISDAFFVNANTVYAVGAKFWKSTDAGSTWTKLSDLPSGGGGYSSLHFLNDQYGWVAGTGGPYKTINGGITWEQKTNPIFNLSSGNVFFTDVNNGYLSDGIIVGKTSNGGNSWSRVFTGTTSYQDLHFISTSTGYIADGSYIYKTEDGGNTWIKVVALPQNGLIELHFTDASHGWACGGAVLKYQN